MSMHLKLNELIFEENKKSLATEQSADLYRWCPGNIMSANRQKTLPEVLTLDCIVEETNVFAFINNLKLSKKEELGYF